MRLCVFMWLMCTREEMIRCPSCTTPRCTSTSSYSSDLVLLPVCVCFSERIRLTSCVLPELCCDEATFCWLHIKITSPSLGSDSSLSDCSSSSQPDSHRSPAQMPWPIFACVCVSAPPASPQQDCQSVCDYTPTHLRLFCFLTIPPPPFSSSSSACFLFSGCPFAASKILIKSTKFHAGK